MRIIGGKYRGKKLLSPSTELTRPTGDRVREAIFNILENRFYIKWQNTKVLDAFAGTGALGLEAFSRGSTQVHFLEKNPEALKILKANIASLSATLPFHKGDITDLKTHDPHPMDLIFMDPPYRQNLIPKAITVFQKTGWIKANTLLVLEMAADENVDHQCTILHEKKYGKTKVLFCFVMGQNSVEASPSSIYDQSKDP